jgi:hypothetical protein
VAGKRVAADALGEAVSCVDLAAEEQGWI